MLVRPPAMACTILGRVCPTLRLLPSELAGLRESCSELLMVSACLEWIGVGATFIPEGWEDALVVPEFEAIRSVPTEAGTAWLVADGMAQAPCLDKVPESVLEKMLPTGFWVLQVWPKDDGASPMPAMPVRRPPNLWGSLARMMEPETVA